MLVFAKKRHRRYTIGSGLVDWIPRALGAAGRFIAANKNTIKTVANVAGSVSKAGAQTAAAIKQISDAVRSKHPALAAKAPERALTEKSMEILRGLAGGPPPSDGTSNINSRIAGAGFRTLQKRAN